MVDGSPQLASVRSAMDEALQLLCAVFEAERTLFIAGNGGSMSDALHISGELMKSFQMKRSGFLSDETPLEPGVPVWVLGINPSLHSAVGNDFARRGMEFAQELFAAAREGDVLLGISTSGKAGNIRDAFRAAKRLGVHTISLTGDPGKPLSGSADVAIRTPGHDTAAIQEYHVRVYHALCADLERELFGRHGRLAGLHGARYACFDFSQIRTYSLRQRPHRTDLDRLIRVADIRPGYCSNADIAALASETYRAWQGQKPVIAMTGAHPIKNGLGPLLIDLVQRGILTGIAVNGACAIHDTELALCGGTSEKVPEVLPRGLFGFSEETAAVVNGAYREAYKRRMGAGETLGAIIAGDIRLGESFEFPFKQHSVFHAAYRHEVPITVHAAVGTDIVDQHPNASFAAKGYASGVDFAVFAAMVTELTTGGVILNISDAVTHPEVLLKSVSLAANVGRAPQGIITAVFDLFEHDPRQTMDEGAAGYYRRDLKSVVVRIPQAFKGRGYYIQGNHKETLPAYYAHLLQLCGTGSHTE